MPKLTSPSENVEERGTTRMLRNVLMNYFLQLSAGERVCLNLIHPEIKHKVQLFRVPNKILI
jgi:hypothetical protein